MADPVQAARQLQWNWEGHVDGMPLEHLRKLCRNVVGYSGWFDRCMFHELNFHIFVLTVYVCCRHPLAGTMPIMMKMMQHIWDAVQLAT